MIIIVVSDHRKNKHQYTVSVYTFSNKRKKIAAEFALMLTVSLVCQQLCFGMQVRKAIQPIHARDQTQVYDTTLEAAAEKSF